MTSSSVLLVLLQLCSLQLLVVVAKPKCQLDTILIKEAHNLLRDLSAGFPSHCLDYNANISYPQSALPAATAGGPHCRQASWAVYETLKGAQVIFLDYDLPRGEGGLTWDEGKLDEFLVVQDRLLDDGSCLPTVSGPDDLSSYFSNVTALVEQQDACAWESLRRDIRQTLMTSLEKHPSCFKRRR